MTELELTPVGTRMTLNVYRDGRVVHRDRFDPISARARRSISSSWKVPKDLFFDWVEQTRVHGAAMKFAVPEVAPSGPGTIFVRPIECGKAEAVAYTVPPVVFIREELQRVPVGHLIDWEDSAALCCLDVDYHESNPPDREWLTTLVTTRLAPRPLAWHFSRSGGLHLFYVAAGTFSAEELAACAALRFRSVDSTAGLELKTRVRGPGEELLDHSADQDTAAGLVAWLGEPEFEEAARDEWLEQRGMALGGRYAHDKCPIDPNDNDPHSTKLTVGDQGIFCFRCNGKGLALGSRRAGFVPWATVLGSPSAGELGGLVRNLAHWGHARYVLTERYGVPEPFARLAYTAALKAYHEGREGAALIPRVFEKVTEGLARVNNLWLTIDESYAYPNSIQNILSRLPVCQRIEDDKVKTDPAIVCELNQTKGISRYGYRNISVVHGYRLASRFLPDPEQTTVAVVNPDLLRIAPSRRYPRYVPVSKRVGAEEAWAILGSILPRIDRVYIRALLASFGCAQETMMGLPPMMFVSGVSAAGKTAMAQVAAGILGARVGNESKFDADESRFREAIRQGAQEGPVVVINELLKDAGKGRFKMSAREALDFILTMSPYSASHQLYKGPVKMGRLPSLVITETVCPEDLREETQLARRIRHHYVYGAKRDWKETIARAGLTNLNLIRAVSDEVAKACDAIMSSVIDDCFSTPDTWDAIADRLGVKTIEDSTDFFDPLPWLREFFRLVCAAPDLTGQEAKTRAAGYKRISRIDNSEEDDLSVVYSMFANPKDWSDARRLVEKDWGIILGTNEPVRADIKGSGTTVYVRFIVGPKNSPVKTNQQVIDPSAWPRRME